VKILNSKRRSILGAKEKYSSYLYQKSSYPIGQTISNELWRCTTNCNRLKKLVGMIEAKAAHDGKIIEELLFELGEEATW
jgi:hypothetical protein